MILPNHPCVWNSMKNLPTCMLSLFWIMIAHDMFTHTMCKILLYLTHNNSSWYISLQMSRFMTPHSLFASKIINNLRFYANMFLPVIILLHRNVVVCTGLPTHLCMWLWWYMSLACAEKWHLYLAGVQTLSVGRWHWVITLEILLVSVGVYRHTCLFYQLKKKRYEGITVYNEMVLKSQGIYTYFPYLYKNIKKWGV